MKSKTKKVTLVSLLASFVMAFACAFLPANVTAQAEDTQVTLAETTTNVAKIGETGYETFGAALTAANNMTGDVVVEIYDKVTLNQSLTGAYNSITFVGKTETAEIYSDIQGYITASKKVNFENLTLSKVAGGYLTDAGFMNLAFNVFGSEEVTYTNCIFVNGACASGAATTYTNCTFYRSHDRYGLWAYGSTEVTVEGCTFADFRGIKLFAEGKEQKTALTVTNTDFSKVNNKPAIVLTSGKSVTLAGNTYSETGVFELDLDGAPNGTPITSNQKITCVNDNGACGVLVDGKIYTTVAQAAEVATAESTVTLLHNSTETVELPEGVTLDKNGYTADGVTVKVPVPVVAKIGNVGYATLEEAFNAAVEGDKIVLCENATPALTSQRAITKAAVIDLNDYTLTLTEDDLYFGTTTFMNGTIVVDPSVRPSTAVFWMFANQTLTFDNVKLVATGVTGTYLIGLDGNNADLNLLNGSEIVVNNTTALDLDIICVNASTGNDIVVDNSKVTVTNLDGRVFFRGNYTISGASEVKLEGITKAGIRIEAGQTLTIADNAKVEIIGEPRDGGIHLTDATAVYVKEDTATVSATVNKPVAVVDGKSYATLKEAIAAVKEGETVTILAGTFEEGTIKLPATLKNVTFKADGKVVLKDMTISASDGNSYSYVDVTFDGIIFDNSRIIFTGWRNGEEIVENLTITNCKFININDTTNTAAVHINKDASEPVNGFTFKNNVIDGAVGGSKSGIYLQATGNVVVENNVINNVSFRPFVIQITTNDGVADEFVVTGNTFSGSAVGRAQGLGNDSTGTDTVNVAVTNNIFKDITDAQQICYWNFNAEKTTTDLSGNYYDIDIEANPNKIYYI